MTRDSDDYKLGRDVTEVATSRSRKTTSVLSVRIGSDELAELERVSLITGKSISNLVREALSAYLLFSHHDQFKLTISMPNNTVSLGETGVIGKSTGAEIEYPRAMLGVATSA